MIVSNPSEAALQAADAISFFDPNRPEWHEVIVAPGARPVRGGEFLIIDIPVDSADPAVVQRLRERIASARG